MHITLPALLQLSNQGLSANVNSSDGTALSAVTGNNVPEEPLEDSQCHAEATASRLLLPIVKATPQQSVLQLFAVRNGSAVDCCSSAQASCTPQAATDNFLHELHSTDLYANVSHCLTHIPLTDAPGPSSGAQQSTLSTQQALGDSSTQAGCKQQAHTDEQTANQGWREHDRLSPSHTTPPSTASVIRSSAADKADGFVDIYEDASRQAPTLPIGGDAGESVHGTELETTICLSAAEAAANNSAEGTGGQSDTVAARPCCKHVAPHAAEGQIKLDSQQSAAFASSLQQDPQEDPPLGKDVQLTAERVAVPLAEMICMVLLLVPQTVWLQAHAQVGSGCCQGGILLCLSRIVTCTDCSTSYAHHKQTWVFDLPADA